MTRKDGALVLASAAIFFAVAIRAVFNTTPLPQQSILRTRQNVQVDCTTSLARDLYGLGVRLGIYFQWFSGWVANNFIVDEIAGALDANAIFLFALLISIINSTKVEDLTQIDGIVILLLCSGTIWSVLSLWGYRTGVYRKEGLDGIRRFGGFGTHLRLLLIATVGSYGLWYWIVGIKGLPAGLDPYGEVPDSCPKEYITIFGVPVGGRAAPFGTTISIAALTYSGIMTLAAPLAGLTRVMKMVSFFRAKQYASNTRLRYATGATEKQLLLAYRIFRIFNFLWIMFIMVIVEITLNENYQIGVLGANQQSNDGQILQPAQLLPMLIGTFSFARILWISFELWRSPDGDITPSLGRHASRRNAKPKRDSTAGFNIFGLFSQRVEETIAEEEEGLHQATHKNAHQNDIWDDKHEDPYLSLHKRLNVFQRIVVTWLPWLSLLYFWPWSKDLQSKPVSQHEDALHLEPRTEPVSLRTPRRTRFADELEDDVEGDSPDTSYRRPSQVSFPEPYDPHKPREVI
ncbi:hypothetical protein H2198_006808 [Neophaeococcomyces mojaviensis]|uniref:Uncharacterized protein n=1 Tax=Neophaeococcomyces mojaviensis TaxID=3383035 RepID=A0ACC3A1Z6_9EURO|nr:hypothetical protein H2198_006808 [Knufia sp. JES_112]